MFETFWRNNSNKSFPLLNSKHFKTYLHFDKKKAHMPNLITSLITEIPQS